MLEHSSAFNNLILNYCGLLSFFILLEKSQLLNKRGKLLGTCPQRRKYLLQNSDPRNEENSA